MNLSIRPMEKDEQLYVYEQSGQIANQCGLIGYLRGDMGSNGDEFFTGWDDVYKNLKTAEFVGWQEVWCWAGSRCCWRSASGLQRSLTSMRR